MCKFALETHPRVRFESKGKKTLLIFSLYFIQTQIVAIW
jgi:hypothetical protein